MTMDEIFALVEQLDGVLTLRPVPGDGSPELSWGDGFFYYAPDGVLPPGQPFATVVTKNYPDDDRSRLERPSAFRVNVAAGRDAFVRWTGHAPRATGTDGPSGPTPPGPLPDDTVTAHPLYGELGWLCVTNPGPHSREAVRELLRTAHAAARARHERRG
ncbi:hypothetical protein DT076_10945 [Desertihabitans brevis]|uniref:DUF6194 domain-containing protein n=1 Tax=Desertihabitans brevis TaxID=2268447 RepID=A0A367YV34_9ACTN|nr:DUF6194 family protein [Desertihabitans brevis]RCK69399.1 hypothetical protein DT076_10945 [Desertihabitans brevis]